MNSEDYKICESIFAVGEKIGSIEFVEVKKQGHLLLGLPLQGELAHASLKLYQPQKLKGKLLKLLMHLSIFCRVYKILPKCKVTIGEGGLLSILKDEFGVETIGVMLSSPVSHDRNVIALFESKGELLVAKAGTGRAEHAVRIEFDRAKQFYGKIRGMPKVVGGYELNNGFVCVTEWVKGSSPYGERDETMVWDLLASWLAQAQPLKMQDIPQWQALKKNCGSQSPISKVLEQLDYVEVRSPVGHGDFAPWNIKISKEGIGVLDWEYAQETSIPSLDGLHYLTQKLILVEGLTPAAVYQRCLDWLKSDFAAAYFKRAGLSGWEEELLGVYLYNASEIGGYDREQMIRMWNSRMELNTPKN